MDHASFDEVGALANLRSQVERSKERLLRLENDASEAEITVMRSSSGQDGAYEALGGEFSLVERELERLRDDISSFTKASGKVMLRFHDLLKRDGVAEVAGRLDQWPLESFITRDEFYELLSERLRARP